MCVRVCMYAHECVCVCVCMYMCYILFAFVIVAGCVLGDDMGLGKTVQVRTPIV